jgi:excisionase family DNA binding protein
MGKLLTIDEVSEILQVKKSTLYSWVHQGKLRHVKVSRLLRFRQEDIDRWIEDRVKKSFKDSP